jgi:hypothetical protein
MGGEFIVSQPFRPGLHGRVMPGLAAAPAAGAASRPGSWDVFPFTAAAALYDGGRIVATRTALIVCILFSASSKTTDAGDSKTSSVTSSASRPRLS